MLMLTNIAAMPGIPGQYNTQGGKIGLMDMTRIQRHAIYLRAWVFNCLTRYHSVLSFFWS
jgi:hypothetical protein